MSLPFRRLAAGGLLLPALFLASHVSADEPAAAAAAPAPESASSVPAGTPNHSGLAAFESTLHYRTGDITLPNDKAVLHLGNQFRYLPPDDTKRLLEQAWGNPDGSGTLGMIVPATVSPLQSGGWGVVVEYEDSGHVSDADAKDINYDDLLADMKKDSKEANEKRAKQGFQPVDIVGWASKPYYDAASNRLHWAKELHFGGEKVNTLNYNIRVLGREGVLILNAVAGMDQLADIKPQLESMVAVAEFTPGNRYADFDKKKDHAAEYGLAALVAGGVAAKAGWLAPLLLVFKKAFVLILVALGWLGKKFMGMFGKTE
ncbi:MAG TPA: DUF2167 domain-containing protein [Moraxellaceae bacterium]|nr:DUF2167 domain-containing protein [Moraxellaceae bacterium]